MIRKLALASLIALVAPACNVGELDFVRDERVTITAPKQRTKVRLPTTIRWRVEDFQVTGRDGSSSDDAGYFGVLVDRAPPAAGKTLFSLANNDATCKATPGCPSAAYLRGLGAYSTTKTEFRLEQVTDFSDEGRRRDFHEVAVILLDGRGARIGEGAFRVEFEVERDDR